MIRIITANRKALIQDITDEIQYMDNETLAQFLDKNLELVETVCDYCIKCSDGNGNCQENIKRWLENDN